MQEVASNRFLTPPVLARRYGISLDKVLGWIRRGELNALNVATRQGGQPRWRISPADLAMFEAARSSRPEPRPTRCTNRSKALPQVEEFYR